MNFLLGRGALLASAIAIVGLAGSAYAQPAPPPPPAADAAGPHHHFDPAAMRQHMADHLRDVLQLQPGQDAALNSFLDAMKPAHEMGDHHRGDGDHAGGPGAGSDADAQLSTPQRLDKMMARMDERRAHFAQVATATKQFYAQLTPPQQKAFDSLPLGRGGRMGKGDWGHGGHGQMGDHGMGPDAQPHG